jgi:glycosyltransferase involved in cell wall biosynthesis
MPCPQRKRRRLRPAFSRPKIFLVRNGEPGEALVADNGSTDGSVMLAQKLGAQVIHVTVRGCDAALIGGTSAAHGTYIIMADERLPRLSGKCPPVGVPFSRCADTVRCFSARSRTEAFASIARTH